MKNGSFNQIRENINQIEEVEDSKKNNIESTNQIIEENTIEEVKEEITKKEYETMPPTVKGYKVIRQNRNSKTKIKFLYTRRNNNKIPKSIGYETIWTRD